MTGPKPTPKDPGPGPDPGPGSGPGRTQGAPSSGPDSAVPAWRRRIEQKLKLLPDRPGVYLMKAASGEILYVGKAKRLPARVRSYFRGEALDPRLRQLRERIRDFDTIVTASEAEALILEANLVRSHRPRYNIELKDDKSYPFIKVTVQQRFPRMSVTRKVIADGSRYFGPFVRVKEMRLVLRSLKRLFPMRTCSDRRLAQGGRPCLEYFIGLCPAPCAGYVDEVTYRETVDRLLAFLEGDDQEVVAHWEARMRDLAAELRFEECARLRDDIERVALLHEQQRMTDLERPDLDVVGLARRGQRAVASIFSHLEGRVVGAWRLAADNAEQASDEDLMRTFLAEHYPGRQRVPPSVVCSRVPSDSDVLANWLSKKAGRRVRFSAPRRGPRAELLRAAAENAALALEEIELIEQGREQRLAASAYELQEALALPAPPVRIEGYDISNLQGGLAVGSQVVFRNGVPYKTGYRRYRIRRKDTPDDFAMLAEMLERRAKYLVLAQAGRKNAEANDGDSAEGEADLASEPDEQKGEEAVPRGGSTTEGATQPAGSVRKTAAQPGGSVREGPAQTPGSVRERRAQRDREERKRRESRPDLILIDGGRGQVNRAAEVLREAGLGEIPVIGLAKREEEVFLPGQRTPVRLPRSAPGLQLLQRVRDEAHRFAVTYHRQLRARKMRSDPLAQIPGLGAKKRQALLEHFGSLQRVLDADAERMAEVAGIGPKLAAAIMAHFAGSKETRAETESESGHA